VVAVATYDHELTLINETIDEDEIGNQNPVETRTTILCAIDSVGRNEFYSGAAAGLRPELVFVVHTYEYSGERIVEFEGKRYSVIRTYQTGTEEIELTVERMIGSG
jgi:SPP1 family predicted phage head-tail adaptor